MRHGLTKVALPWVVALWASPAAATFHQWDVRAVFSNADGSIQYIELFTDADGQELLDGHTLAATSDGVTRVYSFDGDLPSSSTAGRRVLIATPHYASLAGVPAPDYVLPCAAFFDPAAASITIDFAASDSWSFEGVLVPQSGFWALVDATAGTPATTPQVQPAVPMNFAGDTAELHLTACQESGACCVAGCATPCDECQSDPECDDGNPCTDDSCAAGDCALTPNTDPCDDGLFCTTGDTCSGATCVGTGDPCPGELCDEAGDGCVECLGEGDCADGDPCNGDEVCIAGACGPGTAPDCDDGNPCTDDLCTATGCESAPNTAACDDDLFCTATDVCAGGVCTGSGEACSAENCNEGSDTCGACASAADCDDGNPCTDDACSAGACVYSPSTSFCDDGLFCNGTETCVEGACNAGPAPCAGACDEATESCESDGGGGTPSSGGCATTSAGVGSVLLVALGWFRRRRRSAG